MDVREIFQVNENRKVNSDMISPYSKPLWPQHQRDKIDDIVCKYGQGTGYAKWQKERYPVYVSFKREIELEKKAKKNFDDINKYQSNPIKAKFKAFQKTKKEIDIKDLF